MLDESRDQKDKRSDDMISDYDTRADRHNISRAGQNQNDKKSDKHHKRLHQIQKIPH